jgi:hypothetical protein
MPYQFSTDRPESDAPVSMAQDPIRWVNWAQTNAPFTSVTTGKWALVLTDNSEGPLPARLRAILADGGVLTMGQAQRVLALTALPANVHAVLTWAVDHGYGVRIAITGDTVDQYLAKASSASQH